MRIRSLIFTGLLLIGASVPLAPAGAAGNGQGTSVAPAQPDEISAAKRKKQRRGHQAYGSSGTQIACTRFGCQPIPRGCQIVGERTWDGAPSGFDAVVCPYR